jgi:hypothetical protein
MTGKQKQLCERTAKTLNMSFNDVRKMNLEDIIDSLLNKMENDMFDIDDMFTHLQNMKEVK